MIDKLSGTTFGIEIAILVRLLWNVEWKWEWSEAREGWEREKKKATTIATANVCGVHASMNEWTNERTSCDYILIWIHYTFHVIDHQRWKCRRAQYLLPIQFTYHFQFEYNYMHVAWLPLFYFHRLCLLHFIFYCENSWIASSFLHT